MARSERPAARPGQPWRRSSPARRWPGAPESAKGWCSGARAACTERWGIGPRDATPARRIPAIHRPGTAVRWAGMMADAISACQPAATGASPDGARQELRAADTSGPGPMGQAKGDLAVRAERNGGNPAASCGASVPDLAIVDRGGAKTPAGIALQARSGSTLSHALR